MTQKELKQRVQDMSHEQMKEVLRQMVDSEHYVAMLKYITYRLDILNATLWSIDPEDSTKHAQVQGIKSGLLDLSNFAELAHDQKKAADADVDSPAELDEEKQLSGSATQIITQMLSPSPNSVVEE